MLSKKSLVFTASFFLALVLVTSAASFNLALGQSVLTAGLKAPTKIITTPGGNLVVTEAGRGPNTGRISLIDRAGNRTTLVDGLPAGVTSENENSGPAGLALRGKTLFVSIGSGDVVVPGPTPGTEVANPNGPASLIFSSILAIDFSSDLDHTAGSFAPAPDHAAIKSGAPVTLHNAQGETATIKLLADFPDFIADPFTIARPSNPFALALDGNQLYVADSALNVIHKVNTETGATETLRGFAPLANPLPFGPPRVDTVPDGIRLFGDQLLVTFLTGFPFAAGRAEVHSLSLGSGAESTFIGGLTTAIDVLPVKTRNGADQFYVLEISSNLAQGMPGRLLLFYSPTATPTVIAGGLIGPVGLASDARSGDLFITENFTGRVIQIFGSEYDVSLQDDETGDLLRFNSFNGEYLFVSRTSGLVLTGKGRISRAGCVTELKDVYVMAAIDRCPISPLNRGTATIRRSPLGTPIIINDSNTTNNGAGR